MPDQGSAASEHALLQEITAPLETLRDDPLALVDAEFPTAMRGYDRHAVDDYVDQMTRLVGELHATRSPEAAVRRALERVGDQISGVLQRAHETAEQITAQSRAEAEDRLERARREAASLVEAAERRVRELDADADRVWAERARIIADAEALSGQLLAVAQDANGRFPSEETRPMPFAEDLVDEDDPAVAPAAEVPSEPADTTTEWDIGEPPADDPPLAADPATEEPHPQETHTDERPIEEPDMEEPDAEGPHRAQGAIVEPTEPTEPTEPIDPTARISFSHDDSTRIIPPSSEAAQRRRES